MKLKQGLELSAINFVDVQEKFGWFVGKNCHSITVFMENGQLAGVPWALVEPNKGDDVLVNLATVESVEIKGT